MRCHRQSSETTGRGRGGGAPDGQRRHDGGKLGAAVEPVQPGERRRGMRAGGCKRSGRGALWLATIVMVMMRMLMRGMICVLIRGRFRVIGNGP